MFQDYNIIRNKTIWWYSRRCICINILLKNFSTYLHYCLEKISHCLFQSSRLKICRNWKDICICYVSYFTHFTFILSRQVPICGWRLWVLMRVVIVPLVRRRPELVDCHLGSKTRWRCSVVLIVVMHAYQETAYALFPYVIFMLWCMHM